MYIVLQQQLTLLVTAMYRKRGQPFCAEVKFARSTLQDAKREAKRWLSSSFAVAVQQGDTKGVHRATSQSICTGTI